LSKQGAADAEAGIQEVTLSHKLCGSDETTNMAEKGLLSK
jgi:hypothetical protein